MKQVRKLLTLLVPSVIMHRWLKLRHGMDIKIPGESKVQRLLVGLLPYFVSAILQQRKPTDRRVVKYFLPYGKMREHVKSMYNMNVGDASKDAGLLGKVRAALPYGLILWWDAEDARPEKKPAVAPKPAAPKPAPAVSQAELASLKAQVESLRKENGFRADTDEIVNLRGALGGRRPSVTLVLTGCQSADEVKRALAEHLKNSIFEMELLVAYRVEDVEIVEAVEEFARYDSRIKSLDAAGRPLADVRREALSIATGDYLAFLNINDRYSNRQVLEIMVLTAALEKARMCCGKVWTKVAGKAVYPDNILWERRGFVLSLRPPVPAGLAGVLFDCEWLKETGLNPVRSTVSDDTLFLQLAEILAERVFCVGRTFAVKGSDGIWDAHTESERSVEVVGAMLALSSSAVAELPAVRDFLVTEITERRAGELRNLVWGLEAEKFRQMLVAIGNNLPDCAVEDNFLKPLVSIIVPAYNVESYLVRCLDSLVGQTLRSIEIIVVDDGSTDGTPAIADAYAATHDKVKVIHKENGGLSSARNVGMGVARGRYVGFVDSDDCVEDGMYAELSALLERNACAEFSMCGVSVEFSYEVSDTDRMWAQKYFDYAATGLVAITASSACDINCIVPNKLYRRQFIETNRILFPEGLKNEDAVFSFFVMGKATHLVATSSRHYHYMRNNKGIMAKQVNDFMAEECLPDALTKSLPLVAEYLVRDDRRDLLGAFFRRLCGAANGFKSERAAKCVSQLLHKVGFFYNREFLDKRDLGWVRNQLIAYNSVEPSGETLISVDERMLPVLREKRTACETPKVSVIIPVYNQEQYLNFCLETVRKQSLADIEIICVDDGSIDHSPAMLDGLAAVDGRIRVFHRENSGAGESRNFGLSQARGKYIVFIDADDWVERDYLEEVCAQMDRDRLEMCLIDLDCFDYMTRKPSKHYWALGNQLAFFPTARVFTYADLKQYRCMTGPCAAVWSREFLLGIHAEFPPIKNGEDSVFWMRVMPRAQRIGKVVKTFYHYRRGNPTSAVSRMHMETGASNALVTIRNLLAEWEKMRGNLSVREQTLMAGRLSLEVSYACKICKDVLPFMQKEGFERFGLHLLPGISAFAPNWKEYESLRAAPIVEEDPGDLVAVKYREGFPPDVLELIERIEEARKTSVKDLYLITGQLNTTSNAPIDSWTFFKWLQREGIPSRYVMWRKHEWYPRLKQVGELKDVIVLDGNGVDDFEFLFKCQDVLPRCRLFGQENGALNWRIRKWFYYLPDCPYVYTEHGIKYLKYSDHLGKFLSSFNAIVNTSEYEGELLAKNLPGYVDNGVKPTCIVGGLPRLETFRDEREPGRKQFVVFVMFTWRETFNAGQEVLEKSAYYKGLRALLSEENLARLAEANVRIVLAAHHHLVAHVKDLNFGENVAIVPQEEIAYWKAHADCCLTDYSSIVFDYAFLKKPIAFWIPDREDPILTPNDYNEQLVAENRERDLINVCHSAEEVVSLFESYAKAGFELEEGKKAVMRKFFTYRTDICRHLYDALENHVNLSNELPG